jgi:hypothetical protein
MHVAVPLTAFWSRLLYALSSTTTTTFYLRIKMQTWDENFGIKVGNSESENVFIVNFYDRHVPRLPRQKDCDQSTRDSYKNVSHILKAYKSFSTKPENRKQDLPMKEP